MEWNVESSNVPVPFLKAITPWEYLGMMEPLLEAKVHPKPMMVGRGGCRVFSSFPQKGGEN